MKRKFNVSYSNVLHSIHKAHRPPMCYFAWGEHRTDCVIVIAYDNTVVDLLIKLLTKFYVMLIVMDLCVLLSFGKLSLYYV